MLFFSCCSQFEVHKTWTLINVIFKRWKIAVICMYFSLCGFLFFIPVSLAYYSFLWFSFFA